jgi:hypothetical protein
MLFRLGVVAAGMATLAATGTQTLAAQQANRGAAAAPLAPAERSRMAARSILRRLVGTWRFDMWFAGNMDGPPDVVGTRFVSALFDDLRVEWTEEIDHSPIRGRGFMGFDPRSQRFFSTAVVSAGSGAELMTGVLDPAQPLIAFSTLALAPDADSTAQVGQSSALSMLDANHFSWVALDRSWRALFTRQE